VLTATLDNVARQLTRDKRTAGNLLNAFSNQVRALVRSGSLDAADADALLSAAGELRARLP
jgi:predicted DNA-binding protein (UPF0278 family)